MKSLKHINKYFFKYKVRLILGIFFVAISNYFGVFSAPYVRKAVDYMSEQLKLPNFSYQDASSQLVIYGLIILGMTILQGLFMFFMRQTIIVMSRLIEYDMKNEIYEHYQKLDMAFYKRNNTGDLMNRISEDVGRVRMYVGPAIMYIVNTLGTFILTIYVMFSVDVRLSIYVLVPLPILAISIYYVSNSINRQSTKVQEQLSKLSTLGQEAFSGIRVLKAYQREKYSAEQFEKESMEYKAKNIGLVKTEALFQPFMILLIGLSTIFTVYIGGKEAISGKVSYGNIAEFVLYVNKLTWPVASLGWVTSLIQRAAASQTRINEFLHTEPNIKNSVLAPTLISGNIEFKNVQFVYPDSGIKALNGVSFSVETGKSLAIIGRTGSGKSTIANLATRLYDVTSGEILIDGKNIKEVNLESLRHAVGYVPQEVFLFSESISGNIGFAANSVDKAKIEQAAKDADIYNNIIDFPNKFETIVGERGITLSGGQKQRVSIARAIIKEPQILIFDDCLSAVDTETEENILNNLNRIMKGKTTIIISHRVSSVKECDKIIVLDEGRIVEEGNHDKLMAHKGEYYNLFQMQLTEKQVQSI